MQMVFITRVKHAGYILMLCGVKVVIQNEKAKNWICYRMIRWLIGSEALCM